MTGEIDGWVERSIVKTHGNLYRGRPLNRYPIPAFPLGPGEGGSLLDIGCNWGRWTIAAAQAGYRVTGVDPSEKGRGLGGALLRAALDEAKALGVRLYLETSNPVNLGFYRRHGLEVRDEFEVHGSPPIWTMATA